jgi:hypothetical protein
MKISTPLFVLLFACFSGNAQVLYTNTIETGNRYNPGLNQNNSPIIAFDDILMPSSMVSGSDSIFITKVKLGIRRIAGAAATDVKIYYTKYDDTSTQAGSKIKIPPVLLGTISLPANPSSTFTQIVSVGDSINPIFKVKTDTGSAYAGYQAFFIGAAFTNSDANNGIRLTNTFNTYNDDVIWLFNADSSVPRYTTNFGSNPLATFHVQVFGYKQNVAVPVSLANFYAKKENGYNKLLWSTLVEINNAGFNIQKGSDGINFKTIDFVPSSSLGNTSSITDYAYSDFHPFKGSNYYRLQQMDRDGKAAYSRVVLLKLNETSGIELIRVYPNPIIDNANIQMYSVEDRKACLISLYNLAGRQVFGKHFTLSEGINKVNLQLNKLGTGVFQMVIDDTEKKINKIVLIVK